MQIQDKHHHHKHKKETKHGNHEHESHNHHHEHHDHTEHHKMMIKDFQKRFWISLLLTLPILVLSPLVQSILNYTLEVPGHKWILFALSTVVFFYGGWPFLKGLFDELKKQSPGMMTLIAVAITVAFGYSTATTFGLEGKTFFWELATLIDIMLLGHWIEMKSVVGASQSLQKLAALMPSGAHKITGDTTEDVSIESLAKGDQVLVKPGEKIPVDGIITDGNSQVNEAMVTGESRPQKKQENDKVIGGTINGNGSLTIEVQQVGKDAYLNKVIEMVRSAQAKKSKTQNLADRIAFWLTIIALTIGAGTLTAWLIIGKPFVFALERMASVMVITCPHALGLAVPLVAAISTSISAQNGLLIRNRTAFEKSRKITLLAFDKTGTLTEGVFGVNLVKAIDTNYDNKKILQLGAALENHSNHPLAQGITNKAKEENIQIPEAEEFENMTGKGVRATVNNIKVAAVGPAYLEENDIEIPKTDEIKNYETVVYILADNKIAGLITLADKIRDASQSAIKSLQANGIKTYIITGDNENVAKNVSEELKMDGYFAGILPDEKQKKVKELQDKGEVVAMTGDGINDAPALATADVGIAVGSGTDIAAETADIILVNSNPQDIASLIKFGKATFTKMIQNFVWATAYNVVAIPLAAGILIGYGILINPALGALLMSLSTVIVAINAQLLKRKLNLKPLNK
ncbi:MAG TPA: copper-translocating P-type ATPase [Salinivirga sp.]|uniref:copper-translocating P-type ATPase n=1 Tax=Salinivirga sp. TaxID=1970192 RepID=UPI002B471FAA|nr:copper-translocating P-type ATPase [Salinivirga sp.]HKK60901.1 copper-translocating P-type ATPase [Salinivirga sp.]